MIKKIISKIKKARRAIRIRFFKIFFKDYKDFQKRPNKVGRGAYDYYVKQDVQHRTIDISYDLNFYQKMKAIFTGSVQIKVYNVDSFNELRVTRIM